MLRRALHQLGIAHRRGADDDAVDALAEPALDRRHVADAAAELHRDRDRFENVLDRAGVHRLAGERAVEIDDVQIFEALRLEGVRLRGRIAVEHGGARHVALLQAHAHSVLQVDRRKQDHATPSHTLAFTCGRSRLPSPPLRGGRVKCACRANHHGVHFRKLAMSRRPRRWLFSG